MPTKINRDFCPGSLLEGKAEISVFLGETMTSLIHSEFNWPLLCVSRYGLQSPQYVSFQNRTLVKKCVFIDIFLAAIVTWCGFHLWVFVVLVEESLFVSSNDWLWLLVAFDNSPISISLTISWGLLWSSLLKQIWNRL